MTLEGKDWPQLSKCSRNRAVTGSHRWLLSPDRPSTMVDRQQNIAALWSQWSVFGQIVFVFVNFGCGWSKGRALYLLSTGSATDFYILACLVSVFC